MQSYFILFFRFWKHIGKHKKAVSSTKLPLVLSFKNSEQSKTERDSLPGVVVPSGHFLQNDFPVSS